MSHKTRVVLNVIGLALSAAGSICIALSTAGCSTPLPSGKLHIDATTGQVQQPTSTPTAAPRP